MSIKNRCIFLSAIGFALGVIIGVAISTVFSTMAAGDGSVHLCDAVFIKRIGDPTLAFLLQSLAEGIYGMVALGGSAVYAVENWSILKATLIHYIVTVSWFFLTALFLNWYYVSSLPVFVVSLLIFTVAYMFIWLERYLSYRSQIKQINEGLKRMKAAGQ